MYLVNNRYRIIKNISHNAMVSSFSAIDIVKNNSSVQLNMINRENLPDDLRSYFLSEFSIYRNIICKNILKDYSFEPVFSIDNKRSSSIEKYFYINEEFENDGNIADFIFDFSEEKLLDLFVQLCQNINYLHNIGFTYNCVSPQNILISQKSDSFKLRDLVTLKIEKSDYWSAIPKYLYFQAPEIISGYEYSKSSDIYSLGVLLLSIGLRRLPEDMNVQLEFKNFKNINLKREDGFFKLVPVISKMLSYDAEQRYQDIYQIFEDINRFLKKEYSPQNTEDLSRLHINTKMVGRSFEIDTIMDIYRKMVKHQEESKFIFIHGENGIGKTRLLNRLKHLLSFENVNIYFSVPVSKTQNSNTKPFSEILKQFVAESTREILSKYENELIKFIPEIGENKVVMPSEPLSGDMEKFRLMNRLLSFLTECTKGRTTIFIIDDLHLVDEFTLEFIKYIYDRKIKNILFIFTFSDSNNKNRILNSFLDKSKKKASIIDIDLRDLSLQETHEMLKLMLFNPNISLNFSSKIFSKTFGSPQFTEEVIKNLLAKKIIYIDDKGDWHTEYSYDELPLPLNMEQAVISQIKEFDNNVITALNTLSIFNSPIPVAILANLIDQEKDEVVSNIDFLLSKGIIKEKIEDFGYAYDFSNIVLKNLIYSRLDKNSKLNLHKKAAIVLEAFYSEGRISSEELIFHLEKYGEKEKIIKYCLANADIMEQLKNRVEEIKNLKKAISIFDKTSIDKRKLGLITRLAEVYFEDGNYTNAVNYLKMAEKNALRLGELKILATVLNRLSNIYFLKNDIKNSKFYLNKTEELLTDNIGDIKNFYMEEYLESVKNKVELLLMEQKQELANKLLMTSLELCGEIYLKQKGLFLQIIGNIYFGSSDFEEALNYFKESISYFEKTDCYSGITNSLHNIGTIYGECYQDYHRAIYYYMSMKDMSEKNSLIIPQTMAIINLGEAYYYLLDYKLAYKHFKNALEMALKSEQEKYIYKCYCALVILSIKQSFYKETSQYYELLQKHMELFPNLEKENKNFSYATAVMFYYFGDIDKAEKYALKAMEEYSELLTKPSLDSIHLYNSIKIAKSIEFKIRNDIKELDTSINKFNYIIERVNAIFDAAILLMEKGVKIYPSQYYRKTEELDYPRTFIRVEAKRLYLKGMLSSGSEKLEYLNSALKCSSEENMFELKWKILFNIGEYYRNKNKFYAVNYYFEACEIIKLILLKLPKEVQLKYIKTKNALQSFESLLSIKGDKKPLKVKNINDLNVLLNYEEFSEILTDKTLIQIARRLYYSSLPMNIKNVEDLIANLSADVNLNFKYICNYFAKLTLATKAFIILDNHEQGFMVFSRDDNNTITTKIKNILDRVRSEKKSILITSMDMISNNERAVISTPILSGNTLLGYVYIESEKILNDINKESLEKCLKLNQLISVLMEKYHLKINSSIDKLTGTLARKAMEEVLEATIEDSSIKRTSFSVVMFDLDYFKSINDRFGHQTGDTVLRNVCRIVLDNLYEGASCGRFGGEEFVIILPEITIEEAYKFADNLRAKIDENKILGDRSSVTISMGVASYPLHGEIQHELIEKVDQALYVAKELGRNRCQVWEAEFSNKANVTNKLTGILTGNIVQDYRHVSVIVEVINLIKVAEDVSNKIYKLLGRIIEIIESQTGSLLLIADDKISKAYSRKKFTESWCEVGSYDEKIVKSVIENKQGIYAIDWEEINNFDPLTGLPDWPSVIVIPMIKSDIIIGILYLSVPLRVKEFNFNEYNFVESLAQISTAML